MQIQKIIEKVLVDKIKDGCDHFGHKTLKLSVSGEWADGINWFFECWMLIQIQKVNSDQIFLVAGLSVIIVHAGDKLSVPRGFFTNSAGNLLPALGCLGGLYNFCNFVIIFSLM